jgi:hypothetical protein
MHSFDQATCYTVIGIILQIVYAIVSLLPGNCTLTVILSPSIISMVMHGTASTLVKEYISCIASILMVIAHTITFLSFIYPAVHMICNVDFIVSTTVVSIIIRILTFCCIKPEIEFPDDYDITLQRANMAIQQARLRIIADVITNANIITDNTKIDIPVPITPVVEVVSNAKDQSSSTC